MIDEEIVVEVPVTDLVTVEVPGIQGPPGERGEQGDVGPRGPEGIQGPEGKTGPQGPDGKGTVGAEGPQGPKGDQGATGPEGPQGIQGPKGEGGEKGAKGDTGTAGVKGETGAQGPEGKSNITAAMLGADLAAITAQTGLQNIAELATALSASATEKWRITYWLVFEAANTNMDVKLALAGPAGAVGRVGVVAGAVANIGGSWASIGTASTPGVLLGLGSSFTVGSREGIFGVPITATILGGGTAGSITPQYAQNTSDAGGLKLLKGSMVEALKVSV